jgi:hypothetical protein
MKSQRNQHKHGIVACPGFDEKNKRSGCREKVANRQPKRSPRNPAVDGK